MSVLASTIFTLKTDDEGEFVRRWRALALVFIRQPGFIRVNLNRSLQQRGHFLLTAEWATLADYQEAMRQPQLQELARDFPADYAISLYETVVALARPA
jgi:heme-degrading monooxygenase HmoA